MATRKQFIMGIKVGDVVTVLDGSLKGYVGVVDQADSSQVMVTFDMGNGENATWPFMHEEVKKVNNVVMIRRIRTS